MADDETTETTETGTHVVYDTVLERVIGGPFDKATADAVAKSAAHKATVRKA